MKIDLSKLVTAEDKAVAERQAVAEQAAAEALAYLRETDWMVIRALETGKAVAPEIGSRRAIARTAASAVKPEKEIRK